MQRPEDNFKYCFLGTVYLFIFLEVIFLWPAMHQEGKGGCSPVLELKGYAAKAGFLYSLYDCMWVCLKCISEVHVFLAMGLEVKGQL